MKNEHRGIEFFIIEHKDTMKQSSLNSPPKLGGVPNGGGGLTRREDKDKNQQSDRPLRPLGGTSPNLGEELR